MDSLKGRGDALFHVIESPQLDPNEEDVDRKKMGRSKMKKVPEDSEEDELGSKDDQRPSKLNSKPETMWGGDDVLHSTASLTGGQISSDKKRFEFQPTLMQKRVDSKKNDDQQVPSTSRNEKVNEGSIDKKREGERFKGSADVVLHATGAKATDSLQLDPVLLPKVKVAVSGKKKKDPEVSTINLSRIKKLLKGIEDEALESKVKKGSSKLISKLGTRRRAAVLHANGRSGTSSNKESAKPKIDLIPQKGETKEHMDRQILSTSRVRKRKLDEDSEAEQGSKAIQEPSNLNAKRIAVGLLHSTERSTSKSEMDSGEPQVDPTVLPPDKDELVRKRKKKLPNLPTKNMKATKVFEQKKDDEERSKDNQEPSKLKSKPQKSSVKIECKEEGCRHVARTSAGAVTHQALHKHGYLLRCVECDHLFAERSVATKHVRYEHESNEYHKFLVGPPGKDLAVPNADGLYSCIQCAYTTRHLNHMNDHADAHLKGLKISCEVCYSLFSTMKSVEVHKAKKHREVKGEFCSEPNCDHKFRNMNSRVQHLKIHQTGWDYRCTLCHEIFGCKGREAARNHCKKLHEGHPVSIIEVKDGVRPLHEFLPKRTPRPKSLNCSECNYQTTTDAALRCHFVKHRKGFQFACKVCHQLFQTERLQMKHLKDDHDTDVDIACNEEGCASKTTNAAKIKTHREAHRKGWVRQCGICHDVFAGYRMALHHVHSEHPDSQPTVLRNPPHIPTLRKDGGAAHQYKCPFCNSTFLSCRSVLSHLLDAHKMKSKELIGFKIEKLEQNSSSTSQDEGKCPYQQPFPGLGKLQSKFCFYANNVMSNVINHNRIFHESELNKEKSSRLPKSQVEKANQSHLKTTCGIAGCTFETLYTTWMRRHVCGHGAGFPFECNLCHNVFASYGDARSHVTNSHFKKLDLTAISIMPREKVLELMFAAREQHKRDQGIRLSKYRTICMQIHMDILRKQMLRRELRDPLYSGIVIKRVYRCPRCPLKTNTLDEMLLHRSKRNCSKKLESQLQQAKRANERRKKMYGCTYPHCQYETDSSIAYRKHFSKHSIRAPVKCNVCCDIFESVAKCSQHSSAAHPKFVNTTRKALIFREPLEDLVCTACKPYDEFYHSTCFLLHTAMDHPEILPIEAGRIMTTFDADEFQDRRPPLPLREIDFNKKTSLVPADWMQVELDPLEFNYPCDQCDEMFYHPTCVDLHQKMAHRKQK